MKNTRAPRTAAPAAAPSGSENPKSPFAGAKLVMTREARARDECPLCRGTTARAPSAVVRAESTVEDIVRRGDVVRRATRCDEFEE